jgi:hypothetical protein
VPRRVGVTPSVGHIGVGEVLTLVEKRLASDASQRVGEAIAEVQLRGVATALAVVAVGGSGESGLLGCDLDDLEADLVDEVVVAAAGDRVATTVDDDGCLQPRSGGESWP